MSSPIKIFDKYHYICQLHPPFYFDSIKHTLVDAIYNTHAGYGYLYDKISIGIDQTVEKGARTYPVCQISNSDVNMFNCHIDDAVLVMHDYIRLTMDLNLTKYSTTSTYFNYFLFKNEWSVYYKAYNIKKIPYPLDRNQVVYVNFNKKLEFDGYYIIGFITEFNNLKPIP